MPKRNGINIVAEVLDKQLIDRNGHGHASKEHPAVGHR